MGFLITLMWFLGGLSIGCACIVAFIGDRTRAHQGMMEGLGFFVVAALLMMGGR